MKKILITGANGMIGSAIVREFINKYELILVDPYIDRIEQYREQVTIITKSLSEISEWHEVLDGVFCVIHLAAAVHWLPKTLEEEKIFIRVNAEETKDLYNACKKHDVDRFLFFSTNDVYETSDRVITEETPIVVQGIYGKSKLLAEQLLFKESELGKTSICIFRPASIYGENDKGSMKSLISFCRKGIVPMIGKGDNKKALLYIKDAVQAVRSYVESNNNFNGERFNISSGNFAYKEIIETICKCYGYSPIKLYIPIWFCKNIASKIELLKKLEIASETKIVSNKKANILLGYKERYSLEDGLVDAKGYYLAD